MFKIFKTADNPHSGSLSADGLGLAAYDTVLNKYIKCPNPQIITLGYEDNFSSDPLNIKLIALINGAGREMNENKTLGVLNLITGSFEDMLPKGLVAMTPYYSPDGRNILYAAGAKVEGLENLSKWLDYKHPIYKIDTKTKEITQLTNYAKGFDFAPIYINAKDIVFLRRDSTGNISLWKLQKGKETKIIENLIFYKDEFKTQYYYGHFYNRNYIDIS